MSRQTPVVQFSELIESLAAKKVWQYDCFASESSKDVPGDTNSALRKPLDFPSIEDAIVPGDRVAFAVDPNLPQLGDVVMGALKTIGETEAGQVDVVLWDEATDGTVNYLKDLVGESASVLRHDSSHRDSVRYMGADADAAPIYVNRAIVDADFVLPIVSSRLMDADVQHDVTGIFPLLTDSMTRSRYRDQHLKEDTANRKPDDGVGDATRLNWMLGVQLLLSVSANSDSNARKIVAGTPDFIRKTIAPAGDLGDFPPSAPLVVASLDGDARQQTWSNAARAILAASRYVEPDGVIVLWSEIDQPPTGALCKLEEIADRALVAEPTELPGELEDFDPWDESVGLASSMARIASENRILIHSQLSREQIEPMGLGAIEDIAELRQLSQSFESCGVLRAAQFVGCTDASSMRAQPEHQRNN